MGRENKDAHLQDVVAKAYAAVAEPEEFVRLIGDVLDVDELLGGIDGKADMHFENAVAILDKMYPVERADHTALMIEGGAAVDCDLALTRDLRIAAMRPNLFAGDNLAEQAFAPDWLFGLADAGQQKARMKALETGQDKSFFRLHTTPDEENSRWFSGRITAGVDQDIIALDLVRVRWSAQGGEQFQTALSLTDTELALVKHLITGGTVREFAEMRGRSVGTARNQMKTLQRKLSISSKEEVLLLYAGFVHSLETAGNDGDGKVHRCDNLFTASDGTQIAWEEYGDAAGKPVLFFHPLHGPLLTRRTDKAARDAGLRILAPWRPHYGDTSGGPTGKNSPRDFAQRIPEFLAFFGYEKAAGLATQAGMPYLMGMVQERPEALVGAIGAGPFLPMKTAEDYAFLPRRQRNHMRVGRIAPAFARAYLRAMLASIGTGEFHHFVDDYYDDCPAELASVRRSELVDILRGAATYALSNTTLGGVDTMLNWAAEWSNLFADLPIPVQLIVGSQDSSTPPAFARQASEKFALPEPVIVDGANSFIVYDQPEPVMELLAALF